MSLYSYLSTYQLTYLPVRLSICLYMSIYLGSLYQYGNARLFFLKLLKNCFLPKGFMCK